LSSSIRADRPGAPVLDEAHAAFIQHRVSVHVGSCSSERLPSLVRGLGCRVSADRCTVTVFLSVPRSEAVLRDLRAGGRIAVVFSRPSTHETLQLKGPGAAVVPLEHGDRALVRAYGESLAEEIRALGYEDPFVSALAIVAADDAVGIAFRPTAAFVQTPGPSAGQPLERGP
jgi:hypothetical protein